MTGKLDEIRKIIEELEHRNKKNESTKEENFAYTYTAHDNSYMKSKMTRGDRNPPSRNFGKFFRTASRFTVRLPSRGHYNPDLELDEFGEIHVFPMTAKDIFYLNSPEGLLNGVSIREILRNCSPELSRMEDPLDLPINDIDVVFLGIRKATEGPVWNRIEKCRNCGVENEITVNLDAVLDNIEYLSDFYGSWYGEDILLESPPEQVDRTVFIYRPPSYRNIIPLTLIVYEENRIVELLRKEETKETDREIAERIMRMQKATMEFLSGSISCIVLVDNEEIVEIPDGKDICSILEEIPIGEFRKIERHIDHIMKKGLPEYVFACEKCGKENTVSMSMDPRNFFSLG